MKMSQELVLNNDDGEVLFESIFVDKVESPREIVEEENEDGEENNHEESLNKIETASVGAQSKKSTRSTSSHKSTSNLKKCNTNSNI